ncbi:MAG: hypothetical protein M3439_09600 [Chloroflexota bacterium]|nr:hypothetical protein [Chloroflexota bacterium]
MNDHPDATPPPSGPIAPDLGSDNLLRIVPVAQQQQVGDVSLLIYSLELYTTGFLAVVRLSWTGDTGGLPRLTWTGQDDRGTIFSHAGCGGSGGGRPPDCFSWRLGCTFGSPIPADATQLDLSATALGFLTVAGADEQQQPRLERTRTITGPWQFQIPLGDHTTPNQAQTGT